MRRQEQQEKDSRGRKTRRQTDRTSAMPLKRSQSEGRGHGDFDKGARRRLAEGLADVGGDENFQSFLSWICNGKKDDYGRSKTLLLPDF